MTRDRNLYNDAYRALSNKFADDPTVAMTLIPYYFSKRAADDAMESMRLLLDDLGVRDAALLALMSRTAMSLRNADEASILADEAISIEPSLESAILEPEITGVVTNQGNRRVILLINIH